jgi:hypothetical protein
VRECSSSPENFGGTSYFGVEVVERLENPATTIRSNTGMLERVEESFPRRLHYYIDNNGGHFEDFV